MPSLSWMEMLLVGIVALIVIGPKDLPGLFRQVGQFVGKAKGMAREFSSAMNAAADESGINEINKTIKAAANPKKFSVDKFREASEGAVKTSLKAGGETEALKTKLTDERAATAEKLNKAMGKAAEERIAAEKVNSITETIPETVPKPGQKKTAPKGRTVKKITQKKAVSQKPASQKTTTKSKSPTKDAK
ncbi:MAG: Sec-independent protein translocase protein TatB [Octadecabacter sp.]|nr:Sec-independent protein translocase protein TatB [Octadecabacter sp.]